MTPRQYSIREVGHLTGLEESRIRFFEKVFGDFLGFTECDLSGRQFDEQQVSLLRRIDHLVSRERLDVLAARGRLRQMLAATRPIVEFTAPERAR